MRNSTKLFSSDIIVGTMRLGQWGAGYNQTELERFIDASVDLGLVEFDHADIYGHYTSEEEFGQVLKKRADLRTKLRHTTKCGIKMVADNRPDHNLKSYDCSAKHIRLSVENSLNALGVDTIQLLLLHRPDYLMQAEEVAEVFTQLQKEGKVLNFGLSNFSPQQFELLHNLFPLVNHQVEISLLHRNALDDGTLLQCQQHNIAPTAWSPLSGGQFFQEATTTVLQECKLKLIQLTEKYNCALDTLLYAWLLAHPAGITPVTGSSKVERLQNALDAKKINISREDWYLMLQAAMGHEIP